MESISTYRPTHEHNLGRKSCNFFEDNAQKAKIQDGRYDITFELFAQILCLTHRVQGQPVLQFEQQFII